MGGYQVLDLQGNNFIASVGIKINGIYDKIEGTNKVFLIHHIVYKSKEYKDVFAVVTGSTPYVFNIDEYKIKITIRSDDSVVFTDIA